MIYGILDIGKTYKEIEFYTRLTLCLLNGLDELSFMKLFSGHGNDSIDFLDKLNCRNSSVFAGHFNEIIHIVAVETGICRDKN